MCVRCLRARLLLLLIISIISIISIMMLMIIIIIPVLPSRLAVASSHESASRALYRGSPRPEEWGRKEKLTQVSGLIDCAMCV